LESILARFDSLQKDSSGSPRSEIYAILKEFCNSGRYCDVELAWFATSVIAQTRADLELQKTLAILVEKLLKPKLMAFYPSHNLVLPLSCYVRRPFAYLFIKAPEFDWEQIMTETEKIQELEMANEKLSTNGMVKFVKKTC
jgi:hypothetical protein